MALKPRADNTRSPKQGDQWPHKKGGFPPIFFLITIGLGGGGMRKNKLRLRLRYGVQIEIKNTTDCILQVFTFGVCKHPLEYCQFKYQRYSLSDSEPDISQSHSELLRMQGGGVGVPVAT